MGWEGLWRYVVVILSDKDKPWQSKSIREGDQLTDRQTDRQTDRDTDRFSPNPNTSNPL